MIKFIHRFIDFIFPQRCLCCGKVIHSDDSLCVDCFERINFITAPFCKHCGSPLYSENDLSDELYCVSCLNHKDAFRFCRSAILYNDGSKKLLLDFKFSDRTENRKLLAKWLFLAGKDIFSAGVDLLIPIPLHYTRLLKRKYNQSAILAKELSTLTNIPVEYKSLKKIKRTLPQVLCNGKQRQKNVKNAFKVANTERIKNKRIVLIDDVYTTGATMKECTKVLLNAGAKSVDVLTVAKVVS